MQTLTDSLADVRENSAAIHDEKEKVVRKLNELEKFKSGKKSTFESLKHFNALNFNFKKCFEKLQRSTIRKKF